MKCHKTRCIVFVADNLSIDEPSHILLLFFFVLPPRTVSLQEVYFTTGSQKNNSLSDDRLSQLTVVEGAPQDLRCVAVGGYPPPQLRVFIGDRDVTLRSPASSTSVLRGTPGLRLVVVRTERVYERLTLNADSDGLFIKCVAAVTDVGFLTTAVQLHVNCESFLSSSRGLAGTSTTISTAPGSAIDGYRRLPTAIGRLLSATDGYRHRILAAIDSHRQLLAAIGSYWQLSTAIDGY